MVTSIRRDDLERFTGQHAGIVSRAQLLAAGWSSGRIEHALRTERLVAVHAGVYRIGGAPWTRTAGRHAAVMIAGDDAVLARWSAAEALGFAPPRPGPLQVLVPHQRRPRPSSNRLVSVTRTRTLVPGDVREIDGLPVTDPARTLLDLAATCQAAALAELAVAALRIDPRILQRIDTVLDRNPTARGRGNLRDARATLGSDGDQARAEVEIAAVVHLLEAGLPRPVLGHRVHDQHGHLIAVLDLAYPERRLGIEIDGFRWHRSPARKLADEQRQNRLVVAGWTILRFSATAVRDDPRALTKTVAAALGAP
ncbi:MAG: type IV toxin-antitoxin system AbiEi family antitoxin [Nitriliruptoraceae bacterium]